jgi:hypothetical protein
MGEGTKPPLKVRIDRRVRLVFRGATITSDAGLLAARGLDEVLALTELATSHLKGHALFGVRVEDDQKPFGEIGERFLQDWVALREWLAEAGQRVELAL